MKIAINLLPAEFTQAEIKRTKFYKVQLIGILVVLLMVFLSSLSVALRILQSQNIKGVSAKVSAQEEKVAGLKDRQASLLLLKNRLSAISQYLGVSSKQATMFTLLDRLIPSSVAINSVNIDKAGSVIILGIAPEAETLNNMLLSLTDKESNDNLIKEVSVDNISRGRDGSYRVSFSVKPL